MDLYVTPQATLQGEVRVPGDKSISHRAMMLSALATGKSIITGFLEGKDCLATLNCLRLLGVTIDKLAPEVFEVHGVGLHGLKAPSAVLDCANSGTTLRLLAGLLAGQSFSSTLQGDASLQQRPMQRIISPLRQMGARIQGTPISNESFSPLHIKPSPELIGIEYTLPLASAQVKSCLLLAGLYAKSPLQLSQKIPTRDHTERMLQLMGCPLQVHENNILLNPPHELKAQDIRIPADISSAAFFIVAASIMPGAHILLKQVGINPGRVGIITILQRMGAAIKLGPLQQWGNEPVADIEIKGAKLQGIEVPAEWVVNAIDEFPIIFIASACAEGETVFQGLQELRFKETDRIEAMVKGLQILGTKVEVFEDNVIIQGGDLQGGTVDSQGDHRIAMAFAIAGLIAKGPIRIVDCENIATSFPHFLDLANQLGVIIKAGE